MIKIIRFVLLVRIMFRGIYCYVIISRRVKFHTHTHQEQYMYIYMTLRYLVLVQMK